MGWRQSLLGWRPSQLGWRPSPIAIRLEAIAIRLEAIAVRLEAITNRRDLREIDTSPHYPNTAYAASFRGTVFCGWMGGFEAGVN